MCVRACVRACVYVFMCVRACVCALLMCSGFGEGGPYRKCSRLLPSLPVDAYSAQPVLRGNPIRGRWPARWPCRNAASTVDGCSGIESETAACCVAVHARKGRLRPNAEEVVSPVCWVDGLPGGSWRVQVQPAGWIGVTRARMAGGQ